MKHWSHKAPLYSYRDSFETYLSRGSLWRHTFLASPSLPSQSCFLCNLYPTKNGRHWAQFSRQVNQLFIHLKKIRRSLASKLKIRINILSLCPLLTCKLLIPLLISYSYIIYNLNMLHILVQSTLYWEIASLKKWWRIYTVLSLWDKDDSEIARRKTKRKKLIDMTNTMPRAPITSITLGAVAAVKKIQTLILR